MALWTVMFGDDPLSEVKSVLATRGRSPDGGRAPEISATPSAVNIKIFNSREKAYKFRDACRHHGVYASVAYHPYKVCDTTFH